MRLAFVLAVVVAVCAPLAGATGAWRSGNPPTVSSAKVDAQRRLVVVYSAPDGVTFGGGVYLDANPRNAQPVSSSQYGPIMFCTNSSSCAGRWTLAANPGSGPFTFTSEPLDAKRFPAGTHYVQVTTTNEDPYASTRQEEFSNVVQLTVPAAKGGAAAQPPGDTGGTASTRRVEVKGRGELVSLASGRKVTTRVTGPIALNMSYDLLVAGKAPLELAVREGRIVLAPHARLLLTDIGLDGTKREAWGLEEGTAWFSGKQYTVVSTGAAVRSIGPADFTVEVLGYGSHVRAYAGKVDVAKFEWGTANATPSKTNHVVLSAGFETITTFAPTQKPKSTRFAPPPKPFWK